MVCSTRCGGCFTWKIELESVERRVTATPQRDDVRPPARLSCREPTFGVSRRRVVPRLSASSTVRFAGGAWRLALPYRLAAKRLPSSIGDLVGERR